MKEFKIAIIYWEDASIHGREQVDSDTAKTYGLMVGMSCGVIVNETKKYITIATDFFPKQEDNNKDSYRCLNSIPKSGIKKILKRSYSYQ